VGPVQTVVLSKGCIRYRKPEGVDFAVVHALLRETANSTGPVC
jgi:hypothetical protein